MIIIIITIIFMIIIINIIIIIMKINKKNSTDKKKKKKICKPLSSCGNIRYVSNFPNPVSFPVINLPNKVVISLTTCSNNDNPYFFSNIIAILAICDFVLVAKIPKKKKKKKKGGGK